MNTPMERARLRRAPPLAEWQGRSPAPGTLLTFEKSGQSEVSADLDSGWYVHQAGESRGPLSRTDLCRLHSYNELDGDSQVWHPSLENWNPLRNVRESLGIKSRL